MSPIRVALVNDYDVVVRGLADMLSEFDDRITFVDLNSDADVDAHTDIALFDSFASPQPVNPHVGTLSDHPLVRRSVLYTWDLDEAQIESALRSGADGYISKSLPAADLVSAIEAVHAGTGRAQRSPTPGNDDRGDWPGRENGLTPREAVPPEETNRNAWHSEMAASPLPVHSGSQLTGSLCAGLVPSPAGTPATRGAISWGQRSKRWA